MLAIAQYGAGNIFSLCKAIERIGAPYVVTSNIVELEAATHIILPGVGEAASVIKEIKSTDLISFLKSTVKPVLGICIGMQVMCSYSQEGDIDCMGLFPNKVEKLRGDNIKIPHMGWNRVSDLKGALFNDINNGEWFYFVHSYAPSLDSSTIAVTEHGGVFSSALNYRNYYGTQFHPEKSGEAGEQLLRNFLAL